MKINLKLLNEMTIDKSNLDTLWYEDENGNKIKCGKDEYPSNARYQVSRFPCTLITNHLYLYHQEEVDKCDHPVDNVEPTDGWIDGVVGRRCTKCGGTQTKKESEPWPDKWYGGGSREAFSVRCGWQDDLVLAMVNCKDYTLTQAIIIAANSCERCTNALAYKYGLSWGYPEYSEEWKKCGTVCDFCRDEGYTNRIKQESTTKFKVYSAKII